MRSIQRTREDVYENLRCLTARSRDGLARSAPIFVQQRTQALNQLEVVRRTDSRGKNPHAPEVGVAPVSGP